MVFQKLGYLIALTAAALACADATVAQQPVEVRMGVGTASEEQAWLMKVRPDLTPNQNRLYKYNMMMFRSGGERLTAFQAGQLDALTSSTTGVLFAASKNVPIVVPVSMARESTKTFSTSYLARTDSDVTATNLKGKTIGINGYRTSIELYARIAVVKAGLDPERDVKWLIVPLPQMAEALRQKKIDLGVFPSTFAFLALKEGGVRKHPEVVRGWVSDFVALTRFFAEKPDEARKSLLDSGIVAIDPKVYLSMTAKNDLLRTPEATRPNADMFSRLQDELMKVGFQEKRVDINKVVDTSFLPK
jgi:ABC-type nitrate/sulfonate/bicarbonate transport system substrate-binding protein